MMLLVFFLELLALYFLSRWLTQQLYMLLLFVTRSRTVTITVILLLQFPGTVIHELAHLFSASILGVRTGKLTLVPENIREQTIKSGSVAIAASDPFRRYTIGLAPVFAGILTLTAIAYFIPQYLPNWGDTGNWGDWGITLALGYLLFSVSSAMFSSKEDLKGFIPFAIVLGLFVAAAYYLGIRIGLTQEAITVINDILTILVTSMSIVLAIHTVLLGATILCLRVFTPKTYRT